MQSPARPIRTLLALAVALMSHEHPTSPLEQGSGARAPHLDDATIAELLDGAAVTERLEGAFDAWGRGDASTTQRVRASAGDQLASAMAAVVPPYSGGKLYATRSGVFTFVIVLFDDRGELLCTLDGDTITRLRTPAGCALAIRRLAAPDARSACVIGTGRQALPHLAMLHRELPGARLHVWGRDRGRVDRLLQQAAQLGVRAAATSTADEAVAASDVIVTVTSSHAPVFAPASVGDRALVCAVGATKYDRCEIPSAVVARSAAVVCDDVGGSRAECGDLIAAAADGMFDWESAVELHALVAGRTDVPRAGAAPVLFETQGVALQDVATAGLAWEMWSNARRSAVGEP